MTRLRGMNKPAPPAFEKSIPTPTIRPTTFTTLSGMLLALFSSIRRPATRLKTLPQPHRQT